MKNRPETTTSERQLLLALHNSGRYVSLLLLSDWRKEGLLPPLTSRGLGSARGRTYYWSEKSILEQAQCVHDLLLRHRKHSTAILILWLCGYPVSYQKARRALLQRPQKAKVWQVRCAPSDESPEFPPVLLSNAGGGIVDTALLKILLTLFGRITIGRPEEAEGLHDTMRVAIEALDYTREKTNGLQRSLFTLFSMMVSGVKASPLLDVATEKEMAAARYAAETGARLVHILVAKKTRSNFPMELTHTVEIVGEALFLCVLLMQKAGYQDQLTRTCLAIENLCAQADGEIAPGEELLIPFRAELAAIWSAGLAARGRRAPTPVKRKTKRLAAGTTLGFSFLAGLPFRLLSGETIGLLLAA